MTHDRYYLMKRDDRTGDGPVLAGLARRRFFSDESYVDEACGVQSQWRRMGVIAEWERGQSVYELVEVPEEEAFRALSQLRGDG